MNYKKNWCVECDDNVVHCTCINSRTIKELEAKLKEAEKKIAEKNAHAMACHLCQTCAKLAVAVEALEKYQDGNQRAGIYAREALEKIKAK